MATHAPRVIESINLSTAWLSVLGGTLLDPDFEPLNGPVVVSVPIGDSGYPIETESVRDLMDSVLEDSDKPTSYDSASTIFPLSTWLSQKRSPCKEFSDYYRDKIFPRLKALHSSNKRGTYFERMINFRGIDKDGHPTTKNQLEQIVDAWHRVNPDGKRVALRRSALQASIFDPPKDHTGNPLQQFPCLHQVSFSYDESELSVNGYYPSQYIFERGYGNYLGLSHLGYFMADQLKLKFARMNCYVGHFPPPSLSQTLIKSTLRQAIKKSTESGSPLPVRT